MEKDSKLLKVLYVIFHLLITLLLGFFIWCVLAEMFGKQLCNDISICYAVVIFLAGTALTLKIKVLDVNERLEERILFVIGILLNVLLAISAYFLNIFSGEENNHSAILLLNCLIWTDFIITMRNCYLLIVHYFIGWHNARALARKKVIEKSEQDLFETWLNKKNGSVWVKRALTDTSYRNIKHELKDNETNFSLATYGDAVLKICLSEMLLDKTEQLSERRKEFESDKFLVSVIASHYHLLDYIDTDENDKNMKRDYLFDGRKKKNNPHKYIATAVEAMIGAIYKEIKDLTPIIELIENWKKF